MNGSLFSNSKAAKLFLETKVTKLYYNLILGLTFSLCLFLLYLSFFLYPILRHLQIF